jgi:chaperonin GroEL
MDRMAGLMTTKDGVTVAREVTFADHTENQGCEILKQACIKVNDEVGDGTTTVAILAAALVQEGHKLIATGVDPGGMVRGLYRASNDAIAHIKSMSIPVTNQAELERVAFIASNGDAEIARNLAEACMAVGKDGTVTVEDGMGLDTTLEFHEGMEIDQGPCSPAFLGDNPERIINAPLVAVIHGRLRSLEDVQDLMETASQWPGNELVVFCLIAETEALAVMTVNNSKGVMKSVAIGAPGMQFRKVEYLEDLAAISGATMVDPIAGLDHRKWNPEWFGSLKQIVIKARSVTLTALPEAAESIALRMEELRAQEATCVSDYDRDRLKERLAKLSGGLAVLKMGGVTEIAMKERRARVEDALGAVRAALRSGVVPGGGIAYLRAASVLGEPMTNMSAEAYGRRILRNALSRPLEILADNARGRHEGLIVARMVEARGAGWDGWDALTDQYRDLSQDPMIADPTDVVVSVINAAVSVAATLLTVETAIVLQGGS